MTIVPITKDDYLELLRWDDDGGQNWNVVYQIVPDPTSMIPTEPPEDSNPELEDSNPEQNYAKSLANVEVVGA